MTDNIYEFKSREQIEEEEYAKEVQEVLETFNEYFLDEDRLCLALVYPGTDDVGASLFPNQDILDKETLLKIIGLLDQVKMQLSTLASGFPHIED